MTTSTSFAVTWDYRCPFARNAHEHILTGLAAGAEWDVRFVPFSLGQVHVAEGEPSVWDEPDRDAGILALQAAVVVRDRYPGHFPAVHRALFAARHDHGEHIEDPEVIRRVLAGQDIDPGEVLNVIGGGGPLERVRSEHEEVAASHNVWGVPTFLAGDQAVFIRLMNRAPHGADPGASVAAIERMIDLISGWTDLNEFKHTAVPR